MKDKIKLISSLDSDLKYLSEEYDRVKLWGDNPDGDVKFERLMEWLHENKHAVEHMIKVGDDIKRLST